MRKAIRWIRRQVALFETLAARLYLVVCGVRLGRNLRSVGIPMVRRAVGGEICFGNDMVLVNNSSGNPIGVNHACIFVAGQGARISVGDGVGLSGNVINARSAISVGNNVILGANTKVFDHDFHPLGSQERRNRAASAECAKPVTIEDDVFIGAETIILKGVRIGRAAVVGAGAVVTKSIPAGTIWAGNPARQIGLVGAE